MWAQPRIIFINTTTTTINIIIIISNNNSCTASSTTPMEGAVKMMVEVAVEGRGNFRTMTTVILRTTRVTMPNQFELQTITKNKTTVKLRNVDVIR